MIRTLLHSSIALPWAGVHNGHHVVIVIYFVVTLYIVADSKDL